MTSTVPDHPTSTPSKLIQYSPATVKRAERALLCAPFRLQLLTAMRQQSVELKAIAGKAGLQNGYTRRALSELRAENQLLWLIQVGILRREVDGQGLTDSFRLTPLGHQMFERWQQRGNLASPSLSDRLYNALSRWMRLPSWIQS
jgi:hypothetical protein